MPPQVTPLRGPGDAVFLHDVFRHHEEVHGGKIVVDLSVLVRDFRDHHVDDVVGQIVVAAGDENLRAGHAIGAVRLLDRARFHQPEIGAAIGFGQAHRAAPFARHHLGDDMFLHPRRARCDRARCRRPRKAGIHREGLVRRLRHLGHGHRHHDGETGAAELRRRAEPAPARFGIGLERVLEARGRAHHAVLEMAAFLVAGLIERMKNFLAELSRIGENVVDQIGRQVRESGQVGLLFDLEKLVHEEFVVFDRGAIDGHGSLLRSPGCIRAKMVTVD